MQALSSYDAVTSATWRRHPRNPSTIFSPAAPTSDSLPTSSCRRRSVRRCYDSGPSSRMHRTRKENHATTTASKIKCAVRLPTPTDCLLLLSSSVLSATQARPPVTVSVCVNIGAAAVFSAYSIYDVNWINERAVDRSRLNFRASIVYPSFDSRQWHGLLDFYLCNTRESTAYIRTRKDNEGRYI